MELGVIHETLYKRTRTGAIQQWTIAVHGTEGVKPPYILKQSGQLGGKLTSHTESIVKGKNIGKTNETTPYEQAISQALSDWTRKHDEGYMTYADVMVSTTGGERFAYAGVKDQKTIKEDLEHCLPEFNTDATGQKKPMLAKAVDWKKVNYPCFIQPKLDGVRCLMVVTGEKIVFLSRSGKEYTTLNHIGKEVWDNSIGNENVPEDFILDGEIYSTELTFQEICAAVKKQSSNSLKLKLRVYDIINNDNQIDRWQKTVNIVDEIKSPFVWPVSTIIAVDQKQIQEQHNVWVSEGNEGAMIRLLTGKYDQGQRSSSLLKVKEFDSNEYTFKYFIWGQRKGEDLIAVCGKVGDDGKDFKAKMMGTKEYKQKLYLQQLHHKILSGKDITIKHFGLTDDGLPRFPIGVGFRDYE